MRCKPNSRRIRFSRNRRYEKCGASSELAKIVNAGGWIPVWAMYMDFS